MKNLTPLQKSVLVLLPDQDFKLSDIKEETKMNGIRTPKAVEQRFHDILSAFVLKGILIKNSRNDPGNHFNTYKLTDEGKIKKQEIVDENNIQD